MLGRLQTSRFLRHLQAVAEKVKEKEGKIVYEWPTGIEGWDLKEIHELERAHDLERIKVHGCTLGVCAEGDPTKPIKKPWTIMTNIEELKERLKERRCPGTHVHTPCAGKFTKGTGHYPKLMAHLLHQSFEEFGLKRDKLKGEEEKHKPKIKTIQERVERGHVPYRKDCKACVEGAGKTRPHRRVKHPEAAVLSSDIVGPFKLGRNKEKFMLVAAYTLVKDEVTPKVKCLIVKKKEVGSDQVKPTPEKDPEVQTKNEKPKERGSKVQRLIDQFETKGTKGEEITTSQTRPIIRMARFKELERKEVAEGAISDEGDPFEEEGEPVEEEEEADDLEKALGDLLDEEEAEIEATTTEEPTIEEGQVDDSQEIETLFICTPLRSKKGGEVLEAVQEITIKLEREGLIVRRFHSDRGSEFTTKALTSWCKNKGIYKTTTEVGDSKSNGRAELAAGIFKRLGRTLLKCAKLPNEYWPYAVWHTSHLKWNEVFKKKEKLPVFGSTVLVQTRAKAARADFGSQVYEAMYLGRGGEFQSGRTGYVRTKEDEYENVRRVSNMTVIPEVPL